MRVCLVGLICFMSVSSAVGGKLTATAVIGSAVTAESAMTDAANDFMTVTVTAPALSGSNDDAKKVLITFSPDMFDTGGLDTNATKFIVTSSVNAKEYTKAFVLATGVLTLTAPATGAAPLQKVAASEVLTIEVQGGKIKANTGCKTGGITVHPKKDDDTDASSLLPADDVTPSGGICTACALTSDVKELVATASCFCGPADRANTVTTEANLKLCYHATKKNEMYERRSRCYARNKRSKRHLHMCRSHGSCLRRSCL